MISITTNHHKKETVIYGGAFNPPTRAHMAIIQACIRYAANKNADMWLMPSASRRDKVIQTNRATRIELCEALIQDVAPHNIEVKLELLEMDRGSETETYQTARQLEALYPDRTFTWVFGADSIANMRSWNGGEWLLANALILAIDRPGAPAIECTSTIKRLIAETGDIRSTEVRRRIVAGEPYGELVSERIAAILARESIFANEKPAPPSGLST